MSSSSGSPFWMSVVGGGMVGAIITLVFWNSPKAQELLSVPTITSTNSEVTRVETGPSAVAYEQAIVDTVERSKEAVVSIVISRDVPVYERYFDSTPNPFNPFNGFFGNLQVPQLRQNGTQRQEIGGGSGFLASTDGMIVTNRHVVSDDTADYTVFLNDGTSYGASVVARDSASDIAVLQIKASNLPFLNFGNSDDLKVGQTAIAIGNALGEFQNSVSSGIISGLSRSIVAGDSLGEAEQLEAVIQTDAAINPGNSGGPLLNLSGEVIGVNVAVAQGSQNIGFALPANEVQAIVESVAKTGKIVRPYIGVRYIVVTPELKDANNLSVDYGALVVRGDTPDQLAVLPGSPAGKAGLQEGDIILEVDGQKLDDTTSLGQLIRGKQVGDTITLTILSQNQQREVEVTLEEAPQN